MTTTENSSSSHRGGYGKRFATEYKSPNTIENIYRKLTIDDTRQTIQLPCAEKAETVKRYSNLYSSGVNSSLVERRSSMFREEIGREVNVPDHQDIPALAFPPKHTVLYARANTASLMRSKSKPLYPAFRPRQVVASTVLGSEHGLMVPNVHYDPYCERFEAKPMTSFNNPNTPKSWALNQIVSSVRRHANASVDTYSSRPCSMSVELSPDRLHHLSSNVDVDGTSSVAEAQVAICKHLARADALASTSALLSTTAVHLDHTKLIRRHATWLGGGVVHSHNESNSSRHEKPRGLYYHEQLLAHLGVHTSESAMRNPFRKRNSKVLAANASHRSRLPAELHFTGTAVRSEKGPSVGRSAQFFDACTYAPDIRWRNIEGSAFTLLVRNPDAYNGSTPSKRDIFEAVAKAAKDSYVQFDLLRIEFGHALSAVEDSRNRLRGFAAVIDLHSAFARAAVTNPSVWYLSRGQMQSVLRDKLPWAKSEPLRRLVTALAGHRSSSGRGLVLGQQIDAIDSDGVSAVAMLRDGAGGACVKYVRLSVCLLCAVRAALWPGTVMYAANDTQRASTRTRASVNLYDTGNEEEGYEGDSSIEYISTREREELLALLQAMYALYLDCERGILRGSNPSHWKQSLDKFEEASAELEVLEEKSYLCNTGLGGGAKGGIRATDAFEALLCLTASPDDFASMDAMVKFAVHSMIQREDLAAEADRETRFRPKSGRISRSRFMGPFENDHALLLQFKYHVDRFRTHFRKKMGEAGEI